MAEDNFMEDALSQGASDTGGRETATGEIVFSEIKQASKEQIKGNIFLYFLVTLTWSFIASVLIMIIMYGVGGSMMDTIKDKLGSGPVGEAEIIDAMVGVMGIFYVVVLLSAAVSLIISAFMEWGMARLANKMYKKEMISFGDGFEGFKQPKAALSVSLLKYVYTMLWAMIPFLGLVLAFIKPYSYACATFIKQEDSNISSNDAITRSREIMDGRKFQLFLLDFSFCLIWIIPIIFTFGLACIYVGPYWSQARYNFYKRLK